MKILTFVEGWVDLHGGTEAEARFGVYAADLASVLGTPTGSDRLGTTVSGCCQPRVARALSRWLR